MKMSIKTIVLYGTVGLFLNSSLAKADTLKEAILQTMKTNPDVLYSIKSWLASGQGIDKAKGGYFPKLDVTADVGPQHAKNYDTNFDYNTLTTSGAGVSLRQLVFDGFATQSDVASNKNHTLAQTYQVLATANDTALLAAKAYLDVLTSQKIVSFAQDNYTTMQKIADVAQNKGNKADISLAQGRVALAKADLLSAQNSYSDAQTVYYKIVGAAPQNLTMPIEPADNLLPDSKNMTVKNAINNHPMLKSSEASINEARSQYEGTKSNYYPHVDAVLEARADDNLYGVNGTQANEQALLELSYNLFNGGSDRANEKQAGYLVDQAQKSRDLIYTQVVEKARVSWDELNTSKGRIPYLKQHWDSADVSENSYYEEYKKGKRSLVDLLNTEEELYRSKVDYANGQSNVLFSKYWILNSEGFLLSYFQIPTNIATGDIVVEGPKVQIQQTAVMTQKQPIVVNAEASSTVQPTTKLSSAVPAQQQQPAVTTKPSTQQVVPPSAAMAQNKPTYSIADTRISQKAASKYTVQLYSSYNKDDAINFIVSNNIQNKAAFYATKEGAKNKYVVIYGSYIDQNSAMAAINAMPNNIKVWGPTIKMLGKVQEEISS